MKRTLTLFLALLTFFSAQLTAQDDHTFQRRWQTEDGSVLINLDVLALADRGYVFAGLVEIGPGNNLYYPCIWRTDCLGEVMWAKLFNALTETPNNIYGRVLPIGEGDFALVASTGFFISTPLNDIFVARVDGDGNTVWANRIGGGTSKQDVAQGACATQDGGIVLAGKTSSFGSDANTVNTFTDQYFLKIAADGEIVWSRTVGNPQAVDRAYDIAELPDGSLVAAGSYLHNGTFYANLLKLTATGDLVWNRGFGEPAAPQANHAYGVLPTSDGGVLVTGSSTNLQSNFQGAPDFFVAKTDGNGEVEWTRVFAGSLSNSFENAVNAVELPNGNFAVAGATASFPTTGFVPNKFVVLEIDGMGGLVKTSGFNGGSSHYPRIVADPYEGGFLVNGFTNWSGYGGNSNRFEPILVNTGDGLALSGCFDNDLTLLTVTSDPAFDLVADLPGQTGSGAEILPTIIDDVDFGLRDSTICEANGYTACDFVSSTSSLAPLAASFELFPNPVAAGHLTTLRWENESVHAVSLFDVNGRLIQQFEPGPGVQTVDLTIPRAGLFLLRLQVGQKVVTKKIVVQ